MIQKQIEYEAGILCILFLNHNLYCLLNSIHIEIVKDKLRKKTSQANGSRLTIIPSSLDTCLSREKLKVLKITKDGLNLFVASYLSLLLKLMSEKVLKLPACHSEHCEVWSEAPWLEYQQLDHKIAPEKSECRLPEFDP